ncbi:MAG: ThuA domain-containing protein, partial [Armatimonadota bacterium]
MHDQPKALVVHGGWEGHQPAAVAALYRHWLEETGFTVEISDTLDAFAAEDLTTFRLLVPIWTMGTIERRQLAPILSAVAEGVGMAGCHGGMCDAFRNEPDWQFLTGGQWVAHPGDDGVRYSVEIRDPDHPIVQGVAPSFDLESEQYYLHVDPAVRVLATTRFPVADGPHHRNGPVDMPVVWTKYYGEGRVFYNALGHTAAVAGLPDVARL